MLWIKFAGQQKSFKWTKVDLVDRLRLFDESKFQGYSVHRLTYVKTDNYLPGDKHHGDGTSSIATVVNASVKNKSIL